jgi:hypothetical protein
MGPMSASGRGALLLVGPGLILAPLLPGPARAQSSGEVPSIRAVPVSEDIRVDGRLTEEAWRTAPAYGSFIQGEPREGVAAEVPTEVRVLFDESAVYVGARLFDPQAETVARQVTRRDEEGDAVDYFEVSLDSNRDRRTAYAFRITAAGVQLDRFRFDDVESDPAWVAVWDAAVHHDDEGWSVEMRIPLSQLRFEASEDPQAWGVNFVRRRVASNEVSYFALESRERFGGVSVFGRLTGLRFPHASRNLELRPYLLASTHRGPVEEGDPFFDGSEHAGKVGLDLRYGLSSTFVLDLTINPDFGQVEVDPAVINLTAFETFFPERRPFFTRDDRIFQFEVTGPRSDLFYSRRIGRSPQGGVPSAADFVNRPRETTIVSAGKVTGRTRGGLNIGGLLALTGRETGLGYVEESRETLRFEAEPRTRYGIFRVHQELRGGESRFGGIVTAVQRDLPSEGLLTARLPSDAYTGGVDFEHTWDEGGWELTGMLAGSLVRGSEEAIQRIQTSSTHYFQRPDAENLTVDSTATSLTGGEWRLQLSRRTGRHWTWTAWAGQRFPGFEINDMGFGPEGERIHSGGRVTYQELTPGDRLRAYRFSLFGFNRWRHEALRNATSRSSWGEARMGAALNASANVTFLNYWEVGLDVRYKPEFLSGSLTRGGPRMIEPATVGYELAVNNDRRSRVQARPWIEYSDGRRGGREVGAGMDVALRLADWVRVGLDPEYTRVMDVQHYVATFSDPHFSPTYGSRYIFSDLDRRTLGVEGRLELIFSPTTSLQLFAQPLVASASALGYKQLEEASTFEFDRFEEGVSVEAGDEVVCVGGRTCRRDGMRHLDFSGTGAADFSFREPEFLIRSFRSSTVLRWEYRPGSTLFLVWQQQRMAREDVDGLAVFSDLARIGRIPAENTLIVKVNYWLGI